jgi:Zn finger protein HypA/HybF involved in hydrogenase expression
MTKAEKQYLNRVAALSCALCDAEGVHIHHVREGQGMAQRAQNWLAIPLCPNCHTGSQGIHGDRRLLKARKLDEMDLLAMTIERLNT